MVSDIHIRSANFGDLVDIAQIHVQSWRETYAGQVPQSYLDGMGVKERQKKWEELFQGNTVEDNNLYLAIDENAPIGFISFGKSRDADFSDAGEIYAIYLLQEAWGKTAGYSLFKTAISHLKKQGFSRCYLWVLDTNERAIKAYQRWGGRLDNTADKHFNIGDTSLREVAVWFDIL